MAQTVLIVAGGMPEPPAPPDLSEVAFVIAADGGVDTARALGLRIDLAIGDFDSVSAAGLAAAERQGATVERHATAKDATDLELALDAALTAGPSRILVLGSAGGRLDHLLSSLELLASPRYASAELDALLGAAQVHVIRPGSRTLAGSPGELLSLHALHGDARGVTTHGLLYPLAGELLAPGSSRGVSNAFAEPQAQIALEEGVLLAIRPGLPE